jgi:hypothetical protein
MALYILAMRAPSLFLTEVIRLNYQPLLPGQESLLAWLLAWSLFSPADFIAIYDRVLEILTDRNYASSKEALRMSGSCLCLISDQ